MRSYFRYVTHHPFLVLGLAGLVALIFGPFVFTLERETSPDAFIPPHHPALLAKKRVDKLFGLAEPIAVGVIRDKPGGIFQPASLRLIQKLTRDIQNLQGVRPGDVLSITTEYGVTFQDGEPGFEKLIPEIPESPEKLAAIRDDILGYELYRGTLVAPDGSAACILIRTRDESQANKVYGALAKLLDGYPVGDEELAVAGEAAVRAYMGKSVSDDALRMNFIAPVAMAILIVLAFRTVRGTLLPLCVIGGASTLALGSMAMLGVPVYIITNGIFVIIMALGVADSLHLVGQYYEEQLDRHGRSKQEIVVDACTALWYPVLMTSLTDLAGFLALYATGGMPPIQYFGLFTCAGILGALAYSYTVVPAGLMVRPLAMSKAFQRRRAAARETGGLDLVGRIMDRLGGFVFGRRRLVLALSAVLLAAAGWGASKLYINDARILAFKEDHPIVRATHLLNEHFDGTGHLNIALTASKPDSLLQPDLLHRIEKLEAFTETLPYVGGTHSLAGWVKRAHQKMHHEDPAYFAIPQDPEETRFYLDVIGGIQSPMARLLHEVVDKTYTRANLIVRMKSTEFIHQKAAIVAIENYLKKNFSDGPLKAEIAGRANLDYHWLCMIQTTHITSVILSFASVLLLTGFMFRSAAAGLLCGLTVGVAVLVNYAIMGITDIPLGVGTSMFASIAIGAGVNAPIHMLDRLRTGLRAPGAEPAAVYRSCFAFTGRVLFFTALILAIGFLLLCISEFRTLVRFGLLIGIVMMVSFAASVTLLPALAAAWSPRFLTGKKHGGGGGAGPAAAGIILAALLAGTGDARAAEPERAAPIVLTDVASEAGIDFVQTIGDDAMTNIVESTGVGCGFLDYDGDGWLDIYLVSGCWSEGVSDPKLAPERREKLARATDRLYRNKADGTFEDVTRRAGLARPGYGMAVVSADYDGDGDLDLYVTNRGPNFLYRNDGDGTFTDTAAEAGVAEPAFSVGAVFLDYNRDGRLDLYVGNYVAYDPSITPEHRRNVVRSPLAYAGQADKLFRGNTDGTFTDVTRQAGIRTKRAGRAMGVGAFDYDGDGRLDIFVSNDAMENHLWRCRSDGTFTNEALLAGVAFSESGAAAAAMAVEIADYDGDGRLDVLVPDMTVCCLYRNLGAGMFEDTAMRTGLARAMNRIHSWGGVLADLDLDGHLDAYIANGNASRLEAQKNRLFQGDEKGRFRDVSAAAGGAMAIECVSRGVARGDFDNDGDVDLLVNNLNAPCTVLRNDTPRRGRHWLRVRLAGRPPLRDPIGALVKVTAGGKLHVAPRLCAGSYLSQHDPRLHFGLGKESRVQRVEVVWPDGTNQVLEDLAADREIVIRQTAATPTRDPDK